MSGSLRDQLLSAGFKETRAPKKPAKNKPGHPKKRPMAHKQQPKSAARVSQTQQEQEAILERRQIKAKIKALIEASAVKDITGEKVYSYILGAKVKQIYLNPECHEKVSKKELAITRLNGSTYLIPIETADQVKSLNPQWAIIVASDSTSGETEQEYAEFQIPDDLHW